MKLLKLLTNSSIFVSINASIVTVFSSSLYGFEPDPRVLLVAFLATFSVYNMNKATDRAEDAVNRPDTASWGDLYFLAPSLAALFLCLYVSFLISLKAAMLIMASFTVAFFYSIKLNDSIPRLKEVVGVKSLMVALSWGMTGSILPACSHPVEAENLVLVFTYIFIQLLVNTILCDVPDMEGDSASGVNTVPLVLGLSNTRKLLIGINSLQLPLLIYCKVNGLYQDYMPALFFGIAYGYLIILLFSMKMHKKILVDVAVDGEWIPVLILLRLTTNTLHCA